MKHYTDMSAVTVSTRKSAKVKQSRYTPVSDLPSALAIRTDSDDYRLGQVSDRIGLQAGPCRIGLNLRPVHVGLNPKPV